uniref:Uncharacterized protein n=2 Tax=Anopheles christyi TaxID=43041 RepID=A0A182KI90_9DIPT
MPASQQKAHTTARARMYNKFLTVRLLVAGTGTWTTELLRLAATRIRNQQCSVVLRQDVLQFLARRLIDVLLVERDQRLRDSLADGVDLGNMTTTVHPDADINTGELFLAEQQQRLLQLVAQDLRFDLVEWATVHTQQSLSALAVSNGGGGFLASEDLDCVNFLLACFRHV